MRSTLVLACLLVGLAGTAVQAEETADPGKIAWYATWDRGLAEAKRTGRPILLVSAAPHCRNVSGLW